MRPSGFWSGHGLRRPVAGAESSGGGGGGAGSGHGSGSIGSRRRPALGSPTRRSGRRPRRPELSAGAASLGGSVGAAVAAVGLVVVAAASRRGRRAGCAGTCGAPCTPSPTWRPISGSLFGPNTSSATTKITRISSGPSCGIGSPSRVIADRCPAVPGSSGPVIVPPAAPRFRRRCRMRFRRVSCRRRAPSR